MIRERALTKRAQYQKVYGLGVAWSDKLLMIKILPNSLEFSRYGFSVNKPLGKAVTRNHIKRLLKELARLTPIKSGWDIVFIARRGSVEVNYYQLKQSVGKLLSRAGLLMSNDEAFSSKSN
jgi:ribonuclease P protein component